MAEERAKRKLTAILSADVKGYSRLMGENELATVETLKSYREVISSLVHFYRGRVVDSPGDNLLAEFGSVVDAVECAVKIQEDLKERNAALAENRRMEFRIGVNLGDVIADEGRIYGDGVNVAARVEGLAEGGGVCISGTAFDQIGKKLPLGYEYLGEQSVKNIEKPVRVYRILPEAEAAGKVIGEIRPKKNQLRGVAIGAVGVLIILAGALAIWNFYCRPVFEPASLERMAFPLPEKPSIAVLPFVNMSEEKGQEYFSDGLTEEIISALSRVPKLFVIARNSTFTYKGNPVKVQQVSEELGVRYVLEGSVRKSQDRVRITAQLIDAITGHHLWSERYDRDLKDIFALQDEITVKIINALQVELTEGEHARLWGKGTISLEAYLKVLIAREHIHHQTKESNILARRMAEEAIAIDPEYPAAYSMLGTTHMMDVWFSTTKSPKQSLERAAELTQKAIALDDSDANGHGFLGFLYTMLRNHDKGVIEAEKAVALDPNGAVSHYYLNSALRYAGRFEEAVPVIEKAIRLNPFPPVIYFRGASMSYIGAGRYEEAIAAAKKGVTIAPNDFMVRAILAAALSLAGREEEARAEAEEVLRINPKYSVEYQAKIVPFKHKRDLEHLINALRKAGLPETQPLPFPDKPSIAVLPFVNMSGDPEQEYFSDGLTEEIITALSKTSELFVIARNSTFTYKGKPVKVQQVGRELGVKYILEGSVRKTEDKVRITAQLVDAQTAQHLWAEKYDRELKDVFAVTDDITLKIVNQLQVRMLKREGTMPCWRGTNNIQAYLKYLQGWWYYMKNTVESNAMARQLFQEAIALDPEYSVAYTLLAYTHYTDVLMGSTKSPKESIAKALELAQKALSANPVCPAPHQTLSSCYLLMRRHDEAIAASEQAISLDPNYSNAYGILATNLFYAGRAKDALVPMQTAFRIDPKPAYWFFACSGNVYYHIGMYEKAVTDLKKGLELAPNSIWLHRCLAASYSALGKEKEAREEIAELLRVNPKVTLALFSKSLPYKNQSDLEQFLNDMRKAGLPE